MNELNMKLDHIESQLRTSLGESELFNYINNTNDQLLNQDIKYNNYFNFSKNNDKRFNFKINNNYIFYNNEPIQKRQNTSYFSNIRNGNYYPESNLQLRNYKNDRKEEIEIYMKNNQLNNNKTEVNSYNIQPFSDIRESNSNNKPKEMINLYNNIKNKIESLKIEENELEKIQEDIEIINRKINKIKVKTDDIEKGNKSLEINPINNNNISDINDIINKYIKLQENYSDLNNKFDIIKEDQNRNDEKIRKSTIDYNSGDIASNLNIQVKKIISEQQNNLNAEIKKLKIQINTKNYNDDIEIQEINSN